MKLHRCMSYMEMMSDDKIAMLKRKVLFRQDSISCDDPKRILLYFPGAKGQLSITPSGIVDVTENSRFTIACSYTGSETYAVVTWLKNGASTYQRVASNCGPFSGNADQSVEFTCANNGKDFTLTFKEVKKDQDGESWSCGVINSRVADSTEVTIKIEGRFITIYSFF